MNMQGKHSFLKFHIRIGLKASNLHAELNFMQHSSCSSLHLLKLFFSTKTTQKRISPQETLDSGIIWKRCNFFKETNCYSILHRSKAGWICKEPSILKLHKRFGLKVLNSSFWAQFRCNTLCSSLNLLKLSFSSKTTQKRISPQETLKSVLFWKRCNFFTETNLFHWTQPKHKMNMEGAY